MKKRILLLFPLFILISGCRRGDELIEPSSIKRQYKNVVYIIGDGMGYEAIKAGEFISKQSFNFKKWHNYSLNTNSVDSISGAIGNVTDSAAAGTALATGTKTINKFVGKDCYANDLETIMDVAHKKSKSTGIVTTDSLGGATPASFSAHSISRSNNEEILKSQAKTSNVDLFIGKYDSFYHNNSSLFKDYGYTYSETLLETLKQQNKLLMNIKNINPYDATHSLTISCKYALDYLSQNENGFTLMIEQAHIDKYAHDKNFDGLSQSMMEMNYLIDFVTDYFKNRDDTLIIVTADHETGGLKMNGTIESYTYSFSRIGHTKTYVPLYLNKPLFIDAPSGMIISNTAISLAIKCVL